MKELKTISDEKLLRQIQSGNDDAMECLLERYRDMVRKEARSFFLAGGDEEDLIQEGMIGLFKAVTSYQEEKNTSFSTFAYLCVQRQIYTTITAFNRKKHIPLNTAISLFEQKNQEEELSLDEILETPEETPEEMMLRKEELNDYYKMLDQNLSKFEKQVMYHYLNGETYATIAKNLEKVINPLIMRFRGFAGRSGMIRKVKVKIRKIKRRLKTDVLSLLYKAADGS